MEFFKSGLKSVLGSQEATEDPSGAETVERLVERVNSSTLLDDRRNACRALKALSKKHRIEVGAQGMEALKTVLETDRGDCEIIGYALDTLCNIMSPEVFEEEERPELSQESLLHIGEQFTEMFIKNPENVSLVLGFLEEYDFKVRWPALKLLSCLLTNRLRDIQDIILVSPMGVSKLMDLLGDSREVVRNDTLILLAQLTKGNANIQKIVAFENAFDRLFDIIHEEDYADGGIVVEDCLLLMMNLLRNNSSNQNFFKEGSFIQKLTPLLKLPPSTENEETHWSPQKVSNIDCVLKVIRCLISPSNPGQVTLGCQNMLFTTGILQQMSNLLMAPGVPVNVLTEAICAVGETIRGNQHNQEFFTSFMAPSHPPREALFVLLMSMVYEKQSFTLRCSVLYCFQCYLYKNEVGQARIVQTLLPSSLEVGVYSCGQMLCSGLLSHDPVSSWFSSVALSHCLIENPQQKEQLLRVMLAPYPGSQPVSLLQQITNLLQQFSKVQSKIGLLILMSTWFSHCPLAIRSFLNVPTSVPYLTSQAGSTERDENEELLQGLCAFLLGICVVFNDDFVPNFSKESLRQLIRKRVGLETFISKLSEVSRHEQYSKSVKQPQPPLNNNPSEMLLDYEFCKLFKALESMIQKSVGSDGIEEVAEGQIAQYKEMIREQDRQLKEAVAARQMAETKLAEAESLIAQLTDQNTLLRAQVSAGATVEPPHLGQEQLLAEIMRLKNECQMKDSQLNEMMSSLAINNEKVEVNNVNDEVAQLQRDQDDLLELLSEQERKIATFKQRLRALGEKVQINLMMYYDTKPLHCCL